MQEEAAGNMDEILNVSNEFKKSSESQQAYIGNCVHAKVVRGREPGVG
jgi:hypothetical protein